MDINETYVPLFLEALGAALNNQSVSWTEDLLTKLTDEDETKAGTVAAPFRSVPGKTLDDIFYLAERHLVLPMVFEVVRVSPFGKKLEESYPRYYYALQKKAAGEVADQINRTGAFLDCYAYLKNAGHHPLVVKGIVCRSLYPLPDYRQSWDEDLLVRVSSFPQLHQTMLGYGLHFLVPDGDEPEDAYEVIYFQNDNPMTIETHPALFPPDSEVYGTWNRFYNEAFEKAVEVTVGTDWTGAGNRKEMDQVLTLEPEMHFFFLVCHAFKHFLHEGSGIRQITDIILFSERYRDTINWTGILRQCKDIRADGFLSAVFGIGVFFLGRNKLRSFLPDAMISDEVSAEAFLKDVLDAGMQGNTSLSRMHSSTMTLNAMAANQLGGKTVWKSVFPPLKSMRGRYPYLNNAPVLLPVAWVQRIIHYLMESRGGEASGNSAEETLRIGRERIRLMEQLGVIRGDNEREV